MNHKRKVVILYGGKSGEHEVSLQSAASVINALDKSKFDVIAIGIDKQGRMFQSTINDLMTKDSKSIPVKLANSKQVPSLFKNGQFFIDADIVFPVVHGPLYEDGCLQGMLQLCDIPYVGCDTLSSAMSMDKDIAKRLVKAIDVNTAKHKIASSHMSSLQKESLAKQVAADIGFPVFVKPVSLGSSVGTHKVSNQQELIRAMNDALHYDEQVIIEEYIQGQEVELAVLENEVCGQLPYVSTAGEISIRHKDGFYSYRAKYIDTELTDLIIPAKISKELLKKAQKIARDVFISLKCQGMARVDLFVVNNNRIYFNELNTIPGFTKISMYPKLWEVSGIDYPILLEKLIELGISKHQQKQQLVTNYQ
jgi:D-alanine-D-alanine ligase